MRVAALVLALILAPMTAHAAAVAQAANALSFTAGAWRGGPVPDDRGQVQACAMVAPAGGGSQIFFRLSNSFDFSLGLIDRRWNWPDGTVVPMVYWVDNGSRAEVQARATRTDTLLIDVADRESIFQQFRRGLWLNLATRGGNARLSLKGTSVALERLRSCATALSAASPSEPPAPTPAPAPAPAPPPRGK